jgi:hypothetical protein
LFLSILINQNRIGKIFFRRTLSCLLAVGKVRKNKG